MGRRWVFDPGSGKTPAEAAADEAGVDVVYMPNDQVLGVDSQAMITPDPVMLQQAYDRAQALPAYTLMERMASAEATLKQLQAAVVDLVAEAEKVHEQVTRITHAVNDLANALVVQQNAMLAVQAGQHHFGVRG